MELDIPVVVRHTKGLLNGQDGGIYEQAYFFACVATALTTGCATKNYGLMQPLSPVEMSAYDCREIAIELSKVDAFEGQLHDTSRFNFHSALADVNDFGIGNAMAKSNAEKTALQRRRELNTYPPRRAVPRYWLLLQHRPQPPLTNNS